jgi:hypothetical protein
MIYIDQGRKEYVPYEKTVHEHRAPTDQSVSLLNEMQKKAEENLIRTIKVEENTLKGKGIFFYLSPDKTETEFVIKFNLNGEDHQVRGSIDDWEAKDPESFMRLFYEKFTQAILTELIKNDKYFGSIVKKYFNFKMP